MKKLFFILIVSLFFSVNHINAQSTGVHDTMVYLNTIVTNKAQFVGKPFSVLLDSLKIQIKFFSPFASIPHNKTKETSTQFSFYFPRNAEEIYLTYPSLRISWQPYLNAEQSNLLYTQYRGVGWSSTVQAFYATGIIADIKVRE